MRIALIAGLPIHVLPGYENSEPGGHHATWLPQLFQAFSQQSEFELHWLFFARGLRSPEPIRYLGQTFHPLETPGRLRMLRGYRADVRLIKARLAEIQPDLVHAWGSENSCGLAAALSGYPWLLSMQGILSEYVTRCRMHPFVHLQALYERFIFRRAREMTVESHWGQNVLARRAPRARVRLVEYGVSESFYGLDWQPDPTKPIALFVGSVDDRKGIRDALEAFRDPRLIAAGAELRIAGNDEGPLARRLRAISPPGVRWLGKLGRAETAAAMARAWCLVLPTRADTSPNVVKEARVIGLPVVTTPDGGQTDYIHDGRNGFIVPCRAIPQLATALHTLLTDLPRARAMGAHLWPEHRAWFRPERTAEGFLEIYRSLAKTS